jgi:lysophospholipase L1-like esterase
VKWSPSDVYVEVPPGISGTVTVRLVKVNQTGGYKSFSVREEAQSPRVMSFGDSLTYWGSAWTGIKMEEDPYMGQFDSLHINHGRRGEQVTDPAALVRWQDALEFCDSDFAVLMHAVNDLSDVLNPENTIPMEDIQQAMISMIDEVGATDTTLILCTLPPRVEPCGDALSPTTEEYNDWLRSYAGQQGIPLVEVYDDFVSTPGWAPMYFGGNCLHPATEGYRRIGELVNEKILELYLPTCTDLDRDGYGSPAAPSCPYPEPDCDDSDRHIHPGVVETSYGDPICSDGLDNDCDGLTDSEDGGCQECTHSGDCFDGDVCTDDACVDYACVHTYNTDPCNDGDPCTMDDVCSDGTCGGVPLDEDGDTFVSDACSGSDCDDSDPDIHPGMIEAPYGDAMCSDDADNDCDGDVDLADSGCQECVEPEDCDDGLWCNGQETCVDYACAQGLAPDCDDGIACTDDTCNENTDACEHLPNHALCDDGDPCTDDACDSLTGCDNVCNASGPEDLCCQDAVCSGFPACEPPP